MSKYRKIRADKVRPGDRVKTLHGVFRVEQIRTGYMACLYGRIPPHDRLLDLQYLAGAIVRVR